MSKIKKKIRDDFRFAVFSRDNFQCRLCGKPAEDAHHIINRNGFLNGGYVLENGISLCPDCHIKAEESMGPRADLKYSPSTLYEIIGSSFLEALEEDAKGNNK